MTPPAKQAGSPGHDAMMFPGRRRRLFCLLLFLALGTAAGQTTYYVDNAGGSDDASGTDPARAWRSTGKVSLTAFRPGDSVLFRRGGVWHAPLTVSSSGTRERPLTYGAYGSGPQPRIDVNNLIPGPWTRAGTAFTARVAGAPSTLFADTVRLHRGSSADGLGPDEWYYDPRAERMFVRLAGDRDPAKARVEWTAVGVAVAASGKEFVRIAGLAVAAPWDDGPDPPRTATGAGIRVDRCRRIEIISCTVTGSRDENVIGIHIVDVPGFLVSGCEVAHTLYGIAVQPLPAGYPGCIQRCSVHDMDKGPAAEWDGINIGSSEVTDFAGLVIRDNEIARCGEDGIDVFFCKNILIERNYIHDGGSVKVSNNQQGIKSVRPGTIIRYNRIENIASSAALPPEFVRNGIVAGGDSTQVYYNLVAQCGSYGILVDSAQGARVYNNTVLDCPIAIRVQGNATAEVCNNIADRGPDGRPGSFDLDLDGPFTTVTGGRNLLVNTREPNVTHSALYTGECDLHLCDPDFVLPDKLPARGWLLSEENVYILARAERPRYLTLRGVPGRRKRSTGDLKTPGDWAWQNGSLFLRSAAPPGSAVVAYALGDFQGIFRPRTSSPCVAAGTPVGLSRDIKEIPLPPGAGPDIGAFQHERNK